MKKLCNIKYLTKKITALRTFFWSILLQTTHIMTISESVEASGRSELLHAVSSVLECQPWAEVRGLQYDYDMIWCI